MSLIAKLIPVEVQPLTSGQVFHAPVASMSYPERVEAYAAMQFIEKKVKARKDELHARVLDDTAQVGKADPEKGHFVAEVDGTHVTREKRIGNAMDEKKLDLLLEKAGVDSDSVYDKVVVRQLNPSKVEALVATGKLNATEVEALRKVTYALKVSPGGALAEMLEEASIAFSAGALSEGTAPALPAKGKKKSK